METHSDIAADTVILDLSKEKERSFSFRARSSDGTSIWVKKHSGWDPDSIEVNGKTITESRISPSVPRFYWDYIYTAFEGTAEAQIEIPELTLI